MSITFAILTTFLIAWFSTEHTIKYASKIGLVQIPNHRSSHTKITPHGGGIGVVIGMFPIGVWTFITQPTLTLLYIISLFLGTIIAIKGLVDDIRPLSPKIRFTIQTIVCFLLLLALETLPLQSYSALTSVPPILLIPALILCGVWWINLFNFMDGIDGLAGTQAIFMLISAVILILWNQPKLIHTTTIYWMVCLAVAIFGFLLHNWAPARIFMGDVGSTFIAFMIFFFALLNIRQGWLPYSTWLILGACFINDATFTLVRRMLKGERWWEAHRSHAYQRLSRRWGSHAKATVSALLINMLWLFPLAALSVKYPEYGVFLLLAAYLPLVGGAVWAGAGVHEPATHSPPTTCQKLD